MEQFANSQYKIKLSHRMQQVAELVPRCKTVADVGCDHGYVSIELLKKVVVQKAIAMDVRQGPLERAILNAKLAGVEAVMECRLSDGVEKLENCNSRYGRYADDGYPRTWKAAGDTF